MTTYSIAATIIRSWDSNGVLNLSPQFCELFGHSELELRARPLREWIHPDDWPSLEEAMVSGEGQVSARHSARDGSWILVDWDVRTDQGTTVAFGVVGHDEQPLRSPPLSRSGTLAANNIETLEAMARIVEAKNPGLRCSILLMDPSGQHVTVGAGPSLPDEYNALVDGLRIGPAVGSCGTAAYWNVPVVVENIFEDPLWIDLRDAATVAGVSACWSHPVPASDGGVLGAMALYQDEPGGPTQHQMDCLEIAARMVGLAVERDRLEARLQEAAKMEAIGRLAGGVAHDFNNLLTVIFGHVAQIRESLPAAPAARTLEAILLAANHASEITARLLAFGRKQARQPESVEIREVVVDMIQVLKSVIGEDISVSVTDISSGSITIDRTQLGQIMLNLVLNARDAMPTGGRLDIESHIATASELTTAGAPARPGFYMAITVTDSGQGMDEATMGQVFEPFFTTKDQTRGAGLGLATVYGLTGQNGGYVSVKSAVGKGATFTLLFPSNPSPSDPSLSSDPSPSLGLRNTADDGDTEPFCPQQVALPTP